MPQVPFGCLESFLNNMEKNTNNLVREGVEKILINAGLGKLRTQTSFEDKILPEIMKELAIITGQKPALRVAKKSIAGFKVREGDVIGLQVTLRGKRKEDFYNRLVNAVLPRVKDFRGIDLAFLDQGNIMNFGIKEQVVFPEINADQSKVHFSLQVTIVPKLSYRPQGGEFYRQLGLPLKK